MHLHNFNSKIDDFTVNYYIVPESDLGMSFRKVMSRKGLEKVLKKYGNLHSKLHRSPGEETDEFF